MNRMVARRVCKGAKEVLGEEELESFKNDLITPVKKAAVEAIEDIVKDEEE